MSTPDGHRDAPPVRTIRHEISLRSLFSILAIVGGCWLLLRLWNVVLLLVIALILAGTVSPAVDWLERHRIKRALALGLILLALVVAVVGLGALVIPAFVAQLHDLITAEPQIQARLANFAASIPALADRAEAIRSAQPAHLLEPLAPEALPFAGAAAQFVVLALTVVVLAFYLVADHERVQGFAFALLPRRFHLRTARVLLEMETVVGGYVRGQALTSFLIGAFVFIVLWFAGTPHALALAVFAAFADLIPFIGGILALLPAVLATLPRGVVPAVIVFVAILAYQQIEGHIIIPRVYGQTLRLSPLAVLVALLVGCELLGMVGALLALPLAAGLRVLVEQLRIDLPGEQPGEVAQRATDDYAEALYAVQTEGASAVEAAAVATAMAEDMQEETAEATGQAEQPAEEQGNTPRPALLGDVPGR
ncbi:MAG: AI-2E family transporter [Thermomicrobiales bacterium]